MQTRIDQKYGDYKTNPHAHDKEEEKDAGWFLKRPVMLTDLFTWDNFWKVIGGAALILFTATVNRFSGHPRIVWFWLFLLVVAEVGATVYIVKRLEQRNNISANPSHDNSPQVVSPPPPPAVQPATTQPSTKPTATQINNAVEHFVAASKRLADELANARECAAYIGKHCPESMALCDPKPGTVLPLEYEEAIQAERKVVSLDAVRKKVANDASLARSLQGYVLFLQQREQLESEAFHWAKAVASMIVSYGWGGPNAIDPFLALDAPINPKASFDAAAPLHETARAQAQRFNIYVQGMNGAVGAAD